MDHAVFAKSNIHMFDENQSIKSLNRRERKQARKQKKGVAHSSKPFDPISEAQETLFKLLEDQDVSQIFAVGPAGTGKTYVPTRFAIRDILKGLNGRGPYKKLYVARPTVSRPEHRLGALPGKLNQKLEPWLRPIIRGIKDEITGTVFEKWKQEGIIQFLSFEHMRGDTFDDGYVILDEAQNCTLMDLKLFLTRKGDMSRYIITGDPDQSDIHNSGLSTVIDMVEQKDLSPELCLFSDGDVVRSEDAKEWVQAFNDLM